MTTEASGVVVLAPGAGSAIPGAGMGAGTELVVKAGQANTHGGHSLLEWRSAPGGTWVPPPVGCVESDGASVAVLLPFRSQVWADHCAHQ